MKGKRRVGIVVVLALVAAVGIGGEVSSASFPPGVEELLPHAVSFRETAILARFGRKPFVFLVAGDVNADGMVDVICAQGDEVLRFLGRDEGQSQEAELAGLFYWDIPGDLRDFEGTSAVLADLNGDGFPDLVVSGGIRAPGLSEGLLFVFENDRGPRFILKERRKLTVPAVWLELTDLTGDGYHDLLIPQWEGKEVFYLLPGQEGVGFGEAVPYIIAQEGATGLPLFLGDIDGDDLPDLVLLHDDPRAWPNTGFVSVYWGKAQFTEVTKFKPSPGPARHGAVADLTGDGRLELVLATGQGAVVARYTEEDFEEIGLYHPGFAPKAVFVADFDGDGNPDLLCQGLDNYELAVLPSDGRGGFLGRASEYALPLGFMGSLHVADVTGDGLPDLLLAGRSSLSVVVSKTLFPGTSRLPMSGSYLLGAADLSGNGHPDLILQAPNGVEVLWNSGGGGFVRSMLAETESVPLAAAGVPGVLYSLYQARARRSAPPPLYIEAYTTHILLAHDPLGNVSGRWDLGENVLPLLVVGDLDGDGRMEVLGTRTGKEDGGLWVLWGRDELKEYPIPGRAAFLAAADFEGLGRDQVAMALIAEYADLRLVTFHGREPRFSEPLVQLEAQPVAIAAGDIDGDGLPDPAMVAFTVEVQTEPELKIIPSELLLGAFLSERGAVQCPLTGFPMGEVPWLFLGLAIADITKDGVTDVVVSTTGGEGVFVFPGKGRGGFGEALLIEDPVGPLFALDLDGNGQGDLVGSTLGWNPVVWILWNGGGK